MRQLGSLFLHCYGTTLGADRDARVDRSAVDDKGGRWVSACPSQRPLAPSDPADWRFIRSHEMDRSPNRHVEWYRSTGPVISGTIEFDDAFALPSGEPKGVPPMDEAQTLRFLGWTVGAVFLLNAIAFSLI
jgi:hypothetical protein